MLWSKTTEYSEKELNDLLKDGCSREDSKTFQVRPENEKPITQSIGGSRRRRWHPTPVLLPGKSRGLRSLVASVHGVAKSQTWLNDFTFTFHFHALEKEMATHSSVLAWRIPGTGEPGGLPSMGSHRVGHDWSNLAAAAALFHFWF